eukprot:2297987-Prymnesium_polylepis.1
MSRPLERMVAASRRANVGSARWRRRKGRCPRPFCATCEWGRGCFRSDADSTSDAHPGPLTSQLSERASRA